MKKGHVRLFALPQISVDRGCEFSAYTCPAARRGPVHLHNQNSMPKSMVRFPILAATCLIITVIGMYSERPLVQRLWRVPSQSLAWRVCIFDGEEAAEPQWSCSTISASSELARIPTANFRISKHIVAKVLHRWYITREDRRWNIRIEMTPIPYSRALLYFPSEVRPAANENDDHL
jgi:hypothetical protein